MTDLREVRMRSLLPATAAIGLLLLPAMGQSIPAFARRTKLPCTTCHFGATIKLTKFGRDFLIRGHRTAEEEGLKELGDVNIANYVSLSSENTFNSDPGMNPSQSIDSTLSILAGGPIYDDFSFFAMAGLGSDGTVGEAYVTYNSKPTGNEFVFARAGRLYPLLSHVAGTGLGFGLGDPLVWTDDSGPVPIANTASGLSVGFKSKDNFVAELGYTDGAIAPTSTTLTNSKDFFGSIHKELDEAGSYVGIQGFAGDQPLGDIDNTTDHFWRVALVGNFERESFAFTGAYLFGSDDLPGGGTRQPSGFYVEGAWNAVKNLTPYARFEQIDSNGAGITSMSTLGVSLRLSYIGRAVVEGTHTQAPGATTDNLGIYLNFIF